MRTLPLVMVAALCACGANSAEIQKSKSVAYNAEFATVWKTAFEEVALRYDGKMLRATPTDGWILSTWKLVEATRENTVGTSRTKAEDVMTGGGTFFRHVVRITGVSGGPPWREIDGEDALYSPGNAILTPYPRGAPDEPGWVPGRIDDLGSAIYRRLQQYAAAAPMLESGTALKALPTDALQPGATPKSNVPNTPATTVVHKTTPL
jgi:hypothetical protein